MVQQLTNGNTCLSNTLTRFFRQGLKGGIMNRVVKAGVAPEWSIELKGEIS
jgi:hypothetical protein